MVASARRAAANEAEAQVVELGTVASARRAVGGTRPFARYAIAPLAIAAVVGLGVGLMGVTPAVDQTDPVAASTADLGTSRDLARPELFLSPSALPTASPSAVASATPSAAVTPAAATPSASATPTAAGTPAVVTLRRSTTTRSARWRALGSPRTTSMSAQGPAPVSKPSLRSRRMSRSRSRSVRSTGGVRSSYPMSPGG